MCVIYRTIQKQLRQATGKIPVIMPSSALLLIMIPRYGEDDALQLEFHESAPQDLNALCALLSE